MIPIGIVRQATAGDMATIEAWLPKDRSIGTLAANWKTTMLKFGEGQVFVWVDEANREPVAYCWGTLNSHDSILEVKPEYRGRGVGRAMAAFMLESSIADGEPLLEIQIAPESSEPFWQAIGFDTYWEDTSCYGRRILEIRSDLPSATQHTVVVAFLPASSAWSPDAMPLAIHQLEGVDVPFEDKIVLNKTVAHFELSEGENLVIEVVVDGVRRYHGKAKYEGAAAIGVQRCFNGFMISEVWSNEVQ